MTIERRTKLSKTLSKYLRHQPETLGLTLQPGGWVTVTDLLAALAERHVSITRAELDEVVVTNDKQRYSFDETGKLIRANQGHSVEVDLQLEPAVPPDVLYHGTGHQTAEVIQRDGLQKMRRNHVHLSKDVETARKVGARHGRPVIFHIDTHAMHEAGHVFYVSDNGVWLTEDVAPEFLTILPNA